MIVRADVAVRVLATAGLVCMLGACARAPTNARVDEVVDGTKQGYVLFGHAYGSDQGWVDIQQIDRAKGEYVGTFNPQGFGVPLAGPRYRLLRLVPGDYVIKRVAAARPTPGWLYGARHCEADFAIGAPPIRLTNDPIGPAGEMAAQGVKAGALLFTLAPGEFIYIGDIRLDAFNCNPPRAEVNLKAANLFLSENYPLMPTLTAATPLSVYEPRPKLR